MDALSRLSMKIIHSCIQCESIHVVQCVREVFGKKGLVWECIECGDFYMDIAQLQKWIYRPYL